MATPERDQPPAASLRGRLFRGMAVVAVALLAVSAIGTTVTARLGGAIGQILKENYASVVACQDMTEAIERENEAVLRSVAGDRGAASEITADRVAFDEAYRREAANVTISGEGELVDEVGTLHRAFAAAVDAALAEPSPTVVRERVRPTFAPLKAKIAAIRSLNQRNMEVADAEARRLAVLTRDLTIAATAIALVVATWLLARLPRTLLRPIATFTDRARQIGEGNLDAPVPVPEVSELRTLGEALQKMQHRIRAYRESSLGELLAAKDLSRATIAAMSDPVLVFSARGEILLSNDAAERIFHLTPGTADELRRAGAEIPEPIAVARDSVLERGEPLFPQSLGDAMRWITSEGERYFLVRATPLRTEDAGGAAAVVVAQDVTRYRRIDALKSDVVATVSHELKTPLTSLRLATHMLLEDGAGSLSDVQRELATTARNDTERLQGTVDELLDLVRIEREAGAIRPEPVDPAALLREVAASCERVASLKDVHVEIDATGGAAVELDPEQVAIVLTNLVSNAIRHSHEHGWVRLRARADGDEIVFAVEDEGEGIAPEHLGRIFDRHWSGGEPATLKGRHGLGLAIAREIATRHGGTIEVESAVGKGSTFRVRLPRVVTGAEPRDGAGTADVRTRGLADDTDDGCPRAEARSLPPAMPCSRSRTSRGRDGSPSCCARAAADVPARFARAGAKGDGRAGGRSCRSAGPCGARASTARSAAPMSPCVRVGAGPSRCADWRGLEPFPVE